MGRATCTPAIVSLENSRKSLIPPESIFMIRCDPQDHGELSCNTDGGFRRDVRRSSVKKSDGRISSLS
jgi:hypothetical protein